MILPYCPREREDPEFPFVTADPSDEDEYQGHIVEINTDLVNSAGSLECAEILDAYEDGTVKLQWLKPETMNNRRGRKSKFTGRWQVWTLDPNLCLNIIQK